MSDTKPPTTFFEEIKDIKPIPQDKIISQPESSISTQSIQYRKKAALSKDGKYDNFLTDGEIELVEPNAVLSFKISGIQPNVFKNLRRAKYEFDYHLDLHRLTVEQARNRIYKLISNAEVEDFRCLRITHGKGEKNARPARLKSYVNHWLKQVEQVIAFHSALPQHGGLGSVYVLLKKPKHQKDINQVEYL